MPFDLIVPRFRWYCAETGIITDKGLLKLSALSGECLKPVSFPQETNKEYEQIDFKLKINLPISISEKF